MYVQYKILLVNALNPRQSSQSPHDRYDHGTSHPEPTRFHRSVLAANSRRSGIGAVRERPVKKDRFGVIDGGNTD